jgi:AraC family transcriptional regulator, regulatory protein of adaptative response / methylated-DNA-[protein]-cysteine methyltransferase
MMLPLVDQDHLFEALLRRDPAYDGRVFVCVSSTGIFCRLTCPARKPKKANCTFFSSISECLAAGYRACLRCYPMAPEASANPVVTTLMQALADNPQRVWRETDTMA